ncbi:hypothetical protein [Planctomicrobium sp. SH527]|uniref:hypothetical protein n=1 Tax=Planctomicrobium sp. SH527 TaxID=3448123 RepID=UPI003F5ADE53
MGRPRRDKPPQTSDPNEVRVPAGAPTWVTPELIQHTLRVWQPFYEHPLTIQDALDMILSTGRIAEALTEADRNPTSEKTGSDDPFSSWLEKW